MKETFEAQSESRTTNPLPESSYLELNPSVRLVH